MLVYQLLLLKVDSIDGNTAVWRQGARGRACAEKQGRIGVQLWPSGSGPRKRFARNSCRLDGEHQRGLHGREL